MSNQLLTTGEVARQCAVKPDTVLKWIKRGSLPASRTLGGHFRVAEPDVLPLLAKPSVPEATRPKIRLLANPLRCWEFMSEVLREECKDCLVYKVRATWCFRLVAALRGSGHAKQFCTGSCQECPYSRRVHGLPTNVLVVTRDERLIQDLARREHNRLAFRFARSGYDASAVISVFRPAYAVVDQTLLENGEPGLLEALAADPRSFGVRILLGVRCGTVRLRPFRASIAGTIEQPFTSEDILSIVERFPVELLPVEEDQSPASARRVTAVEQAMHADSR